MSSTPTPTIQTKPIKCLVLEAFFNDSLVVATLPPIRLSKAGIHLPNWALYRRDEDYAMAGLEFMESTDYKGDTDYNEAEKDLENGYWDTKNRSITPFTTAIVIGEGANNERSYNPPMFGDILLLRQMTSVQYHGQHKLGADTSAGNEILYQNFAGDRTVAVGSESDILTVPVEDVIVIVARYSEIRDWAEHGYRTDRNGAGTSAVVRS